MSSDAALRLLVVDDDPDASFTIRALLELAPAAPPVDVEQASTFERGLELTRSGTHDVVLLDHGLGGRTGLDLLRACRAAGVETPVIVFTGRGDEQVAVDAMKAGATDYLVKHRITPELLVASLRYALERRDRERLARQVHDAQLASEQHLREIASINRDTVRVTDLRTGTSCVSDAFELAFGWPVREVPDCRVWWTERVHPGDRATFLSETQLLLEGAASSWSLEYRFRRADGSYAQVLDRAHLIRDAQGRPQRIVGSLIDISSRARREEDLRQSQKLEAIGRLAGGVAHDFNNLLTAIIGYSELLTAQVAPGPQLRAVEQIREAGRRAAALTHQLLAFSRKQVLQPELLDPSHVVAGLEDMLRRLIPEDIEIAFELSADAGRVRVDRAQLEQVILNLAVNARDAMPQGGRLLISTCRTDDDPPRVRLQVTDTGCGMPQHVLDHLFEPFFTTKELGKGTGLGLSTVYGIVTQSGGEITARSRPAEGTTFEITLPACHDAPAPASGTHRRPHVPPKGGRETVLVVEDEAAVRHLAVEVLTAAGYEVLEASRGDEALRLVADRTGPLHLVLSDVVLPGMSGGELVARLTALQREVRVLFMSGYPGEPGSRADLDAATPLLDKPFTPERLAATVRSTLDAAPVG